MPGQGRVHRGRVLLRRRQQEAAGLRDRRGRRPVGSCTGCAARPAAEQSVAGSLNKGDNAQVNQVSCGVSPKLGSIITCAAVGYYTASDGQGRAFTATMANGKWGPAAQVPGSAAINKGGFAQLNSVSCPTAGNCSAGGSYAASKTSTEPFVVTERNGTWGKPIEVPGSTTLNTGLSGQGQARLTQLWPVGVKGHPKMPTAEVTAAAIAAGPAGPPRVDPASIVYQGRPGALLLGGRCP
jgi:hypothetical protein